ncbi:aldehyde dehydrogenase family protein [Jiangella alba]|uniref:2-formylbenzoate dehydrogenase n=1 Tax=Jiangella alba TaxID=561176 RepID=A0A1H5PPT7_9ACTN|nr:aldehyde dehydrogenase family protein [Jiangella alba]SEF15699.1 2-formylbenzoate dehydrogenase [Jiangella alba]
MSQADGQVFDDPSAHDWRLLSAGRLTPAAGDARYDVENPATGATLARVPDAGAADVAATVQAADDAAAGWAGTDVRERAAVVRRLADVLDQHVEEIARLDSLDGGFPLWMMRKDIGTAGDRMRMFADWALHLRGETIPSSTGNVHFTERVPFGVVARIIAYNHPGMFGASKIAAPLVAGNTVVLKPSDLTPLSALRLGELWAEHVPAGVFSVVSGSGVETGDALVRHPAVRRIAFTGSPQTGRAIQRAAAESGVKDVSLELGGKNALVVFPDADLDAVVEGAVKGMNFAFAGQSCGSTSRVLVHADLAAELVDRLRQRLEKVVAGAPFDDGVTMGPLISAAHRDRVAAHVRTALDDGARLVCGGDAPAGGGHYYPATLLDGVEPDMRVARTEIFGPVISVLTFRTEQEAVDVANGVDFGLTASVYTRDFDRAHRMARAMRAGYVWVNDTSTHFIGMPFGGVKESGVGREESMEELLGYTQIKSYNLVLR